ncbi:MAG: sulfatase-like hydrolase/transferase [Deltaproteobacteria bacterium]|nr:sulfatase-like hydrolase/transferase [Deltaproteobacteria bacterium]
MDTRNDKSEAGRTEASPALVSGIYLLVLYLIFTLLLRVWNTIILARAGALDFDLLGPPFSLLFLLGEELVIGAALAAVLGLVWRFKIPRFVWLAAVLGYLGLLAGDQMSFKVYFTHWDYVLYVENHDAGRALGSLIGMVDTFVVIDLVLAALCVVLAAIPFRPRLVRSLAELATRKPVGAGLAVAAYLGLSLTLANVEEQHDLSHSWPVAFASSYLDVRAEEREIEQAVLDHEVDVRPASLPAGASQGSPSTSTNTDDMAAVRAAIAARKGKLNVVWYFMESVSYRETSLVPDAPYDTTPFVADLADESLLFTRYYAGYAASTRSFFSAMTGLYPYVDKTADLVKYSQLKVPTLVDILHDEGYATAFFASSDSLFESLDSFLAARKYDSYLDKNLLPASERPAGSAYWGVPEEAMIDKALEWIASVKDAGRPFYLNYNAVFPHHPFKVPAGHEAIGDLDWGDDAVRKNYRATLNYADQAVRRFYEGLERLGVLDDTLFIVTPDHGEAFGDLHPKNHIHASHCYEEDSRIFLILHNPEALGAAHHSQRLGSHKDLLPTLLEALGLDPEIEIDGRSLIAADYREDRMFYYSRRQIGVRDGDLKLVVPKQGKRAELYDLSRDPTEQNDLSKDRPDDTKRYAAIAKQWRVDVARAYRDRVKASELSDREIGRLAGKRRQQMFAGIRVLFQDASLCGGGGCMAAGGTRSFNRGSGLTVKVKLRKGGANVKLDVYSPRGKRVHNQLERLSGKREVTFAPIPTGKLEPGKRYHVRVTTVVYHAVHDVRAFYFTVSE